MSTAADSNFNHLAEDASDESIPKGSKNGQGRAVRGGPTITPEATPEPDFARTEADRERRQEEEYQSKNSYSDTTANDKTDGTGDVIQDILKCSKDEHRKVLGIEESYADKYEE